MKSQGADESEKEVENIDGQNQHQINEGEDSDFTDADEQLKQMKESGAKQMKDDSEMTEHAENARQTK